MSTDRPICPQCKQRFRAIAYHKYGRTYYRSRCISCRAKNKKIRQPRPKWESSGYKKKTVCDRCGFRARYSAQTLVYHIDGNLNNTNTRNLKTICLNCVIEVQKNDVAWRPGELSPDV